MPKFCQNCGNKLNDNAEICLNCGIMIKKETSQRNDNETGAWLWFLIIPAIVIIIPIIFMFLSAIFSGMFYAMY